MMKVWKKEIILLLCTIVGVMATEKNKQLAHVFDNFITLNDIQGRWTNSDGDNVTVKGLEVKFSLTENENDHIEESDDIFTLNSWVLKKSSKTFTWKKNSKIDVVWYRWQEDEETCWGCLDQIEIPMKTLCGHISCSNCFYDFYVTRRRITCAICRKSVSDKLFQTIIQNNEIRFLDHMFAKDKSLLHEITKNGNSFLQLAVKNNLFEMAEFLLKSGANPNVCNTYGKTALSTARTNGNQPIINLLMEHYAIAYDDGKCLGCHGDLLKLHIIETDCNHEYCAECFLNFFHEKNMSGVCKCGDLVSTQSLFSKATQFKDLQFMKDLIFSNPGITKIQDRNGDSLLHHAIKKEWVELIMFFLENHLDTKRRDKKKNTLLHIAIQMESISFVEALLKTEKINIMLKNKDKETAFDLARKNIQIRNLLANHIAKNLPQVADYFIERYYYSIKFFYSINTENIYDWIVQYKLLDLVKLLYEKDNKIQLEKNINGETLLTVASKKGWIELVKFLLGNLVSSISELEGKDALFGAIQNGHKKIIELLFSAGAANLLVSLENSSVNAILSKCDEKMLYFLLKIAVQKQNHVLAMIFLSNGAKTAPVSCASDSLLITAVRNEDELMVQTLLRFGANNVNFRTRNGESALSIAAQHGFSNIVKSLILHGANKEHFTHQHHTPLSLAVSQNHIKVIEILFSISYQNAESAWIDPNVFQEGYKHLMPIFNVKSRDIAEILIENDARTEDIFDENGKSPLTYAASNRNLDLIEFFLQHGCKIDHMDKFHNTPISYANDDDAFDLLLKEARRKRKRAFKNLEITL